MGFGGHFHEKDFQSKKAILMHEINCFQNLPLLIKQTTAAAGRLVTEKMKFEGARRRVVLSKPNATFVPPTIRATSPDSMGSKEDASSMRD